MQGTQYATKRSILCRGAFCGPTELVTLISLCICCQWTVSALWCCGLVCELIVISERRQDENTGRENN